MQFIFDNLTASVVALTTTLLLFAIQSRATQNNVARTSRNMMEEQTQTFASWLERDLERMGENMDQDDPVPYEDPHYTELDNGTRITEQLTFYRDSVDNDDDEHRIATRYEVEQVGTRMVDGNSKPLFELTRRTKVGGGTWSGVRGTSPSALGYFRIDMLDRDAKAVSSPKSNSDQVHSIRVRFSVVSPFQNQQTFPRVTHVGSVLLLRKKTGNTGKDIEIKVPETWTDCIPWGGRGGWKTLTHPDGSPFDNADDCFDAAPDSPGGWWDPGDDFWG